MSSWSMDDGSALSGTYTFTNGSAIVQGNSSADTSEIKVGDVVIDDNGDKVRVASLQPTRTVATSGVNASNEQITITTTVLCKPPLVYRLVVELHWLVQELQMVELSLLRLLQVQTHLPFLQRWWSTIDITGTGITHSRFKELLLKRLALTFSPSTNSGSSCTVTDHL